MPSPADVVELEAALVALLTEALVADFKAHPTALVGSGSGIGHTEEAA